MSTMTFADWRERFPEKQQVDWLQPNPIQREMTFVYSSVTAPLLCGAHCGLWQWFATPMEALSYVWHVLLVEFFEAWLGRERVSINRAEVGGCRCRCERPGRARVRRIQEASSSESRALSWGFDILRRTTEQKSG